MSRKRNYISILALLLALASLAAAVFSCIRVRELKEDYEAKLAEMESIHVQLQQEIDDAAATEPAPTVVAELKSWELKSRAWYDSCGAAVTLTAVPASYQSGMTAAFRVTLDGQTAAEIPCAWDGKAFTAVVDLTAQNSYTYICILNPESSPTEIILASPENPTDATAVYLADSLHSYCTLGIGDWSAENNHLVLSSCHLQVQLPQVTTDGKAARCQVTKLILRHNGETLRTHWVTLNPGEAGDCYALDVENLSLLLPRLEEGDALELWLEVTLSGDQILTAIGGSWDYLDGQLQLTAG